jgi:hypothetical protein
MDRGNSPRASPLNRYWINPQIQKTTGRRPMIMPVILEI